MRHAPVSATALILLFDGHCRFCTRSAERILRWAAPGAVRAVDLHSPDGLAKHPSISPEAAMASIHVVMPDGRIFRGLGAIVRALWTRFPLRAVLWLYFVPGIQQLAEAGYRIVARNRYRLGGRANSGPDQVCDTACRPAK